MLVLIRYKLLALCIELALGLSFKGYIQDKLYELDEDLKIEYKWYKGLK